MISIFGNPRTSVREAQVADCDTLSELHGEAFRRGWSAAEFEALLVQEGVHALIADHGRWWKRRQPAGFVLYRMAVDEAEILSIAVARACRRRGIARQLMDEALRDLYRERVRVLHLEVEDGNLAAMGLYQALDFRETNRRPGYYAQTSGSRRGALMMQLQLR